jgi:hypothetical protein
MSPNYASASPLKPAEALKKVSKGRKIPSYLVRETIDGVSYYYAAYRDVLNKKKTLEEIMADSGLQSVIKAYLMILFAQGLDLNRFYPLSGEVGAHLDHRNNLALDMAVYDTLILTPDKINQAYIEVQPRLVVEIDVKVSLGTNEPVFDDYVLQKVKRLLSFGTERIIWIFTRSQTILVAKPGNVWEFFDLHDEVLLLDGVVMNLGKYLKERGIEI